MKTILRALPVLILLCTAFTLAGCGTAAEKSYSASAKCSDGALFYSSNNYPDSCKNNGGVDTWYSSNFPNGNINPFTANSRISNAPDMNGVWSGTYIWSTDATISIGGAPVTTKVLTDGGVSLTINGGKIVSGEFWNSVDNIHIPVNPAPLENASINGDISINQGRKISGILSVVNDRAQSINGTVQVALVKQ